MQEWDASNIEHIVYPDAISKEPNCIIYTTSDNAPLPFNIGYGVIKNNMVENVGVMVLDSSITTIESACFANLENLTTIILPNNITTIGERAFYGCRKLTTAIIGENIETIDRDAFYACDKLNSISCKSTTEPKIYISWHSSSTNTHPFPHNKGMVIYVPRNSYDSYTRHSYDEYFYAARTNWYFYKSYIQPYDFQ